MNAVSSAGSTRKLTGAQQRLVECHVYLVEQIARPLRRRRPPHVHAELGALARHGLVAAAGAFDPARGVPFEGFARPWIRGFVNHELRRCSIAANDVAADHAADAHDEGDEVAAPGPALDDVHADEMLGVVTGDASRRARQGAELELAERRDGARALAALANARRLLDTRTQEVLRLRYDERLEWREVARRLGISEATARRAETEGKERLARLLRAHGVTGSS